MVDMWVARPGERERLADLLRPEGERVQAELKAMEQSADEGSCRLCGSREGLTEEHTPSKKAGNLDRLLRGMIDYEKTVTGGEVAWTVQLIQGGASATTLCAATTTRAAGTTPRTFASWTSAGPSRCRRTPASPARSAWSCTHNGLRSRR